MWDKGSDDVLLINAEHADYYDDDAVNGVKHEMHERHLDGRERRQTCFGFTLAVLTTHARNSIPHAHTRKPGKGGNLQEPVGPPPTQ